MIPVDALAPDFTLPNQHGDPVNLRTLGGRKVVIVFIPNALSRICGGEVCSLRDDVVPQIDDGTRLVTISTDSRFVLRHWAQEEGFEFDLLSDFWPHGSVAREYGVLDEATGTAVRATFVLDAEQVVRWSTVNGSKDARNALDYLEALRAIA